MRLVKSFLVLVFFFLCLFSSEKSKADVFKSLKSLKMGCIMVLMELGYGYDDLRIQVKDKLHGASSDDEWFVLQQNKRVRLADKLAKRLVFHHQLRSKDLADRTRQLSHYTSYSSSEEEWLNDPKLSEKLDLEIIDMAEENSLSSDIISILVVYTEWVAASIVRGQYHPFELSRTVDPALIEKISDRSGTQSTLVEYVLTELEGKSIAFGWAS